MQPKNILYVLVEKVVATYVQAFLGLLLVGPAIDTTISQAAAIAAIPAALTALVNALPGVPLGLPFAFDLILRTIRTYVVAFIGFAVAVPVFSLDYSILQAASAAAIPGALAVIKAGIGSRFGSPDTASLLPERLDIVPVLVDEVGVVDDVVVVEGVDHGPDV